MNKSLKRIDTKGFIKVGKILNYEELKKIGKGMVAMSFNAMLF